MVIQSGSSRIPPGARGIYNVLGIFSLQLCHVQSEDHHHMKVKYQAHGAELPPAEWSEQNQVQLLSELCLGALQHCLLSSAKPPGYQENLSQGAFHKRAVGDERQMFMKLNSLRSKNKM